MPDALLRLALALAIGLLVGVERGWNAREVAEGGRTAGIRTYALIGGLGGVAALLGRSLGGIAFAAILLAVAVPFAVFKQREEARRGGVSVTDVVAAVLVFCLGAFALTGDWRLAAGGAVATAGLLASKQILHAWLERLTWAELRSALIILAMSFIVLPLLPNRTFGPHGLVNPYEVWLLTIAMAGISFGAYAGFKLLGPSRGVLVASAVGALVSSTAVTLYLARLARDAPDALNRHVGAALVAGAVMACRLTLVALVLFPPLGAAVAWPLGAFALVSGGLGALATRSGTAESAGEPAMKSPLDLGLVLKAGLVLGVVYAAAKVVQGIYGAGGVLPVAAVAGLVDADAATLAVGRMTAQGLDLRLGAYAVILAGSVDSVSKAALAIFVGGRRFGERFAAGTLVAMAVSAAATGLWWSLGPAGAAP